MAIRKAQRRTRRERREAAAAEGEPRHLRSPHLCLLRAPVVSRPNGLARDEIRVATYNVHRWTGMNGRGRVDPARAAFVISEIGADVVALQEVMRPHGEEEDPLVALADALGMHLAFAATRVHRQGELGNAILCRWPLAGVSMLDLSFSRIERRVAVSAQVPYEDGVLDVVATHLALADRTRHRQVRSLLDHPKLQFGPTLLLGDMNAWRKCPATRALDQEMREHHNLDWPASFPSARPVLALDRVYARGIQIVELSAHQSQAARRASDHLPVVARVRLPR